MASACGALSSAVRPRRDVSSAKSQVDRYALVEAELRPLRAKPWRSLVELPQVSTRDVPTLGREASISIWRELAPPDAVRIVGQLHEPALMGMTARITVLGFQVLPGGETRELVEKELWDYT